MEQNGPNEAAARSSNPDRATSIHQRVNLSLERITPLFPGDTSTGILNSDYEDSPLFADEDSIGDSEPCPVLDPATGTCGLYTHRPIVCRTFGPPMRIAEGDLATCELCFVTASAQEIASAELDPSIPHLEVASNDTFNTEHHVHGETIVAFALKPREA